jgi:hypothetical protein
MAHNINHESNTGRNILGTLIAGAFLTALTVGVDKVATDQDRRHRSKTTRIVSHEHEKERVVYMMPGCRADGEYIGEMLEPHIQHIGTTRNEAYAEDDFDLEESKGKELEERSRDMGRAAVVYCLSMGGVKFAKSLTDENYREKFGKIDTLLLDSSPADVVHLASGTRFAMRMARMLPPSWTVSRLYRGFMRRHARTPHAHSSHVTDEQVIGHQLSSANTPLRAVRAQAKFIEETHFEDGELAEAAKDIDKIYYISAKHDHVVDVDAAYEKWNRIFGGRVIRIIDEQRPMNSHADGPEFPEKIVELMEGSAPKHDEPNVVPLFQPEQTFQLSSPVPMAA